MSRRVKKLKKGKISKKSFINVKGADLKFFFKSHRLEFIKASIILSLLIVIYFLSMFLFQVRGNYAEQIIMESNPQYVHILLRGGEGENISIETDIRANLFCRVSCDYQFIDLSTNYTVVDGSFIFHNYKKHEFVYELSVDKLGSGQELYLYQMTCVNVESNFCSSSLFPVTRFSTVTLNYVPSLEQELLKSEVDQILIDLEDIFVYGKSLNDFIEEKLGNLRSMRTTHLFNELLKIKFYESIISKEFDKINEYLETQNYTLILDHLKNNNVLERFIYFKDEVNNFDGFIKREISAFNHLVLTLTEFEENVGLSKLEIARLLNSQDISGGVNNHNVSFEYSYNDLVKRQNSLVNTIKSDDFLTYNSLSEEIDFIAFESNYLEENIIFFLDQIFEEETQFLELYVWKTILEKELCLIHNCTYVEEEFFERIRNINRSFIKEETKVMCEEINSLRERYYETLDSQLSKRINLSSEEIILIDNVYSKKILELLQELKTENKIIQIINNYEEKITYNESIQSNESIKAYRIGKYLTQQSDYFFDVCVSQQIIQLNLEKEQIVESAPTIINLTLIQQVTPQCCYAGICKPCCDYEDCRENQQNPLLVIHGYSFYSFNSALHSTNAFVDFSKHLLKENLYYPAGIIGPYFYEEYVPGDLSRTHVPPLFFGTYYNVVRFGEITPGEFNVKSQSISDYADEIDDLINIILNATNKSKIDIVAHSMGGLVLREYLTKYSGDNIGKIILIGTPNQGVPSRLVYLCKFFGGQIECDEMNQKSIFLDRLNKRDPPQKEIHMISGEGCNTFGEDGDGIVQSRSALLSFAENYRFKGNCNVVENFHRDMIKPTYYEEIYDLVKKILLE